MTLALIGVSNGAVQFMTYEELKKWRVELRRKRIGNKTISEEEIKKLVSSFSSSSIQAGSSKLTRLFLTERDRVIWNTF